MADAPSERRFFISHASRDKAFAVALKERLTDHAWVDLYEIALGDMLLEEIAAGIEGATDFVLLWSEQAAESRWVRFELHMAFIRHLEDRAIAIRVVVLDDTPLPLYLRPFLQGRHVTSPDEAAELLEGAPPRVPSLRAFVNRNREIDAVESALYSPQTGHIWLWGMTGIGKREIAREALARVIGDVAKVRTVEVRAGTGFVELGLLVSAVMGAEEPPPDLSEADARDRVEVAISEYTAAGGIWSFSEVQNWLDEDGRPGPVLEAVLRALEHGRADEAAKLAVFTSTRRPTLEGAAARMSDFHRVTGLRSDFAVALLRSRGAAATEEVMRQAAEELDGHPLALELVAPGLASDTSDWEDLRARAATGVVAEIRLASLTEALIERLAAVDGPLPVAQYAAHLDEGSEPLQAAIEEGASYSLIEQDASGFVRLHGLVRDFYMRSFRRRDDFAQQTADLAARARAQLEITTPGSATYVDTLLMTFRLLCWAGQLSDAIELRQNLYGTLHETAVELYNQRRYRDAKRYFELVVESTEDNRMAKLYLARTLAYLGELDEARAEVDRMLEERPNDHGAWRIRGRIEYIAREFRRAIAFYERANELRPGVPSVLRDLGQARMRVGDWYGARAALRAAMERQQRDPDPYLAFQYSQVLEHFEEFEKARAVIAQAIRRDPRNVGFHHRLGRIAEALGDRATAISEYERCLELDPTYVESLLSLASLAADDGDLDQARARLGQAQRIPNARPAVLHNVEAKILLRDQDFAGARSAIQKALAEDRDLPSLGLAARIELAAILEGESRCSDTSGAIRAYAEEIRVQGQGSEADGLLRELAAVCL